MSDHPRTSRASSLVAVALLASFSLMVTIAAPPDDERESAKEPRRQETPRRVGGRPVAEILELLGARLTKGVSESRLRSYRRVFGFTDRDGDGRHSRKEYVTDGRYMTPEARSAIFRAADSDRDGFVSREEYVFNRIVTDEAKAILQEMDTNGDRVVERKEFIRNVSIKDDDLARKVFEGLDANKDGRLPIPEYLRVWGQWARVKPERTGGDRSRLLRTLDLNGDGILSAEEIAAAAASLKKLDRNGDGELSGDEYSDHRRN